MAALKKKKKAIGKNKGSRQADIISDLYKGLAVKEREAVYEISKKKSVVTGASGSARTKQAKRIVKAAADNQVVRIPSPDYVDRFIEEQGMEIDSIRIDKKNGYLFFVLNNGLTIQDKISRYPLLKKATVPQLRNYHLYAGGTCVEWKELDEDLSLRGLLKQAVFEPLIKTLTGFDGLVLAAQ
jgi:hypothetical protein